MLPIQRVACPFDHLGDEKAAFARWRRWDFIHDFNLKTIVRPQTVPAFFDDCLAVSFAEVIVDLQFDEDQIHLFLDDLVGLDGGDAFEDIGELEHGQPVSVGCDEHIGQPPLQAG